MADARPWYREPETFIAVAALVVSISAVAVGLYEAALQRRHDRAEVWPHVEVTTFTSTNGATLSVENTGIGPALIKSIAVTVDGKRTRNWNEVLTTLLGHTPPQPFSNSTISESALRPGNRVTILGMPNADMPPQFWSAFGRVGLAICYGSVFDEYWQLSDSSIGHRTRWTRVDHCPAPSEEQDF